MENFEAWVLRHRPPLGANQSQSLGAAYEYLREINHQLLTRHASLFDPRHCLREESGTHRGHPYFVQTSRLSQTINFEDLDTNIQRGRTLENYLGEIADLIATEIQHEDELEIRVAGEYNKPACTRCPYIPVIGGGVVLDISTLTPILHLMTRRARIPLNQPCPPCEVGRNADLTKFGLPPLK